MLYIAYPDQLVRAAVAAEPTLPAGAADAPRRITSPFWRARDDVAGSIGGLVEEGATVSSHMGSAILAHHGLPLSCVEDALQRGRSAPARGQFGGLVFEAHSAALAYVTFACSRGRFVLVIDMGAGTTDIAGFEHDPGAPQFALKQIPGAQQWCTLAGDELDSILIDLFMRAGGRRRRDGEARLWRDLRLSAHRLKCDLFRKGAAAFDEGRRRIVVRLRTLQNDVSFRAFCRALTWTFIKSLHAVAANAKNAGADKVTVLLAGGGSGLPFLADLVKTAAARAGWGFNLEIAPFGANWALPHQHHPLGGSFPQVAISMGGALAQMGEEVALAAETV